MKYSTQTPNQPTDQLYPKREITEMYSSQTQNVASQAPEVQIPKSLIEQVTTIRDASYENAPIYGELASAAEVALDAWAAVASVFNLKTAEKDRLMLLLWRVFQKICVIREYVERRGGTRGIEEDLSQVTSVIEGLHGNLRRVSNLEGWTRVAEIGRWVKEFEERFENLCGAVLNGNAHSTRSPVQEDVLNDGRFLGDYPNLSQVGSRTSNHHFSSSDSRSSTFNHHGYGRQNISFDRGGQYIGNARVGNSTTGLNRGVFTQTSTSSVRNGNFRSSTYSESHSSASYPSSGDQNLNFSPYPPGFASVNHMRSGTNSGTTYHYNGAMNYHAGTGRQNINHGSRGGNM
ncbi:hypothetical protein PQX77_003318 [Marasmius sp. AFHP31]|nr:hypothetical protein PQX77_003318 [Marasmius sp. AFHP31]